MSEEIRCPKCGFEFEISEVLTSQIKTNLKQELETEYENKEASLKKIQLELEEKEKLLEQEKDKAKEQIKENLQKEIVKIKSKAEKEAKEKLSIVIEDLKNQLTEKEKKISDATNAELELRKKNRELENKTKEIDIEIERRLDKERDKIEAEAFKKFSEENQSKEIEKDRTILELKKDLLRIESVTKDKFKVELDDLKNQISEKNTKINEATKLELELRKKMRDIESKKEELDLELARKLDEERLKIKDETFKKFYDEHHLKDLEKDKLIQDLKKSLEDAKRKAEQGSVQIQGEVLELNLENVLSNYFSIDEIVPVPKGIKGADVIQKVFNPHHKYCGIILWEAKSTRNWSDKWIHKLKDDQREISADIVSRAIIFPTTRANIFPTCNGGLALI